MKTKSHANKHGFSIHIEFTDEEKDLFDEFLSNMDYFAENMRYFKERERYEDTVFKNAFSDFFEDAFSKGKEHHINDALRHHLSVFSLIKLPEDIAVFKKHARTMLANAHPDRGGTGQQFIRLKESYDFVIKYYQS